MSVPIRIVGGGLAGLSLGIALRRRGVPVTVFEAGTYPRHRVCGEFISGVSEETLRALGIFDLFATAFPATTCGWFDAKESLLERSLPRTAWSLSRFDLDRALAGRFAELGGELREGTRHGEGISSEGVVWTAGRRRERSEWVGLKMHVRGLALKTDLEMHVASSGYVGLNRIAPDRVNVCGLFLKREVAGAGAASLVETLRRAGFLALVERLGRGEPIANSFCSVSAFRLGWQAEDKGLSLRLGDAAAMIAPFTGNGMSMAFEGAALAVDPLVDYAGGGVPWSRAVPDIRGRLRRAFRNRLLVSRITHPLLRQGVLFRAFAWLGRRQPALFDRAFEWTRN